MKNSIADQLLKRFSEKQALILDGATGTEIERHGLSCKLPLWSTHALIADPSIVQQIHEDYIEAGSEIITANTFRTNKRVFKNAGVDDRSTELTHLVVRLAKDAVRNKSVKKTVWVAGSMASLEDCYRPDLIPSVDILKEEHTEHAQNLINAGVDIIFIETMNSSLEANYALEAAMKFDIPVFVGFVANSSGKLLSGESFSAVVDLYNKYKPAGVMINCTPVDQVNQPLEFLLNNNIEVVGVYANIGHVHDEKGWESTQEIQAVAYAENALKWVDRGVKLIGGCCGTSPEYIREIKKILYKNIAIING